MSDPAAANDTAQIITALGGLGGVIGAIAALIFGFMNKSNVDTAKTAAGTAQTAADAAKTDASEAKTEADNATKQAAVAKADANIALTKALEAIKAAEDAQTKAQVGWLELQLRVHLSSRRDKIHDVARDLEALTAGRRPSDLTEIDKARMIPMMERFISAHEDFLGALEQACRHHEEGKTDVSAFRRMYEDEIRAVGDVEEGHPFYKMMYPEPKSKFKAIWSTYKKWFVSHLVNS
jgi:hypothetical protein